MHFEYACFISYRRGEGELMKKFPPEFVKALRSELETHLEGLPIFIDEAGIEGGDIIDSKLAKALWQSACMVILFIPKYFSEQKPYCTREFLAINDLREQRKKIIEDNQMGELQPPPLVITIAFRGVDELPSPLREIRYYDFSGYSIADRRGILKNPNYMKDIRDIAESIVRHFKKCKRNEDKFFPKPEQFPFELPSEDEARDWLVSKGIVTKTEKLAKNY